MHVFDVVSKVIYAEHGWAVAEQFDDTAGDPGAFPQQNINALEYIKGTVKDLVIYGPFDEDSTDELRDYLEDLEEYLNEPYGGDDEDEKESK